MAIKLATSDSGESEADGIKVGNAIKLDSSVRASREGFPVFGDSRGRGEKRLEGEEQREGVRSVSDLILDLKACDLIGPPARERARPLGASSQGKTTNCISGTFLSSLG